MPDMPMGGAGSAGGEQVLIVGAGPTGLVLALWLAQRGVPFRIVDKNTGPGQASRAMAVQARTLEFYRQLGFEDEVVAGGIRIKQIHLREGGLHEDGREIAYVTLGDIGLGISPYPFVLSYPQDDHERFLIAKLRALGVAIEWQVELKSFVDDGVHIRAVMSRDGIEEVVSCRYLCGCDGARSAVRENLGLDFPGGTYEQLFYVADVTLADGPGEDFFVSVDARELCVMLPVRSSGRKRVIGTVAKELEGRAEVVFDDVRPSAERLLDVKVEGVEWFSTYRVHHRVAAQFRVGRAFLAGDAGHLHSPAGGQGMNTGIGDAVNLAWKLADVMQGRAGDGLLETYENERIAFARTLVSTTDTVFRAMVNQGAPGKLLRTWLLPNVLPWLSGLSPVRRAAFRTVSQMRIHYPDSALSEGEAGEVRGGDRLPWIVCDGVNNFDALRTMQWQLHVYGEPEASFMKAVRELGVQTAMFPWSDAADRAEVKRDGFYLVRPDGYVALASAEQEGSKLRAYCKRHELRFC